MRTLRPELPEALDRVVRRGLERDKSKRWSDLESFKAALLPFLPGHLSVGGLGFRFSAYFVDTIVLFVLVNAVRLALFDFALDEGGPAQVDTLIIRNTLRILALTFGAWMLYFAVFEAIWGYSFGKWIFRLAFARPTASTPQAPLTPWCARLSFSCSALSIPGCCWRPC